MFADSAHLVISILLVGVGIIFLRSDWRSVSSRALSWCMFAIGGAMLSAPAQIVNPATIIMTASSQLCEILAIYFGIEWGRLLSQTAAPKRARITHWLFRSSQVFILIYGSLSLGYILMFPEYAVIDPEGVVKVRAVEFAVFAPLLGTSLVLSGLALLILMVTPLDSVERIRFRALLVAGPLFLLTILMNDQYEPLIMAVGLVVFLGGSVHYLAIQHQRGTAMRQFVSPELANMVNQDGVDIAMQRDRRVLSVVACDLRGFTRYARRTDSATVISLLERYYARIGLIAAQFDGTVKDHAGDGILILVGAPKLCANHAEQAVRLARAVVAESSDMLAEAHAELGLGVGVATGEATVGAIHGAGRLEYVAVGNVVNLAARLCDRAADREILIDEDTRNAANVADICRQGAAEELKGYAEPVAVYALNS